MAGSGQGSGMRKKEPRFKLFKRLQSNKNKKEKEKDKDLVINENEDNQDEDQGDFDPALARSTSKLKEKVTSAL